LNGLSLYKFFALIPLGVVRSSFKFQSSSLPRLGENILLGICQTNRY